MDRPRRARRLPARALDGRAAPVNAIERRRRARRAPGAARGVARPARRPSMYLRPGDDRAHRRSTAGQWMVSYPASRSLRSTCSTCPNRPTSDGSCTRGGARDPGAAAAAARADPWLGDHPPGLQMARRRAGGAASSRRSRSAATTLDVIRRDGARPRSPREPPGSTRRPSAARERLRSASGPARHRRRARASTSHVPVGRAGARGAGPGRGGDAVLRARRVTRSGVSPVAGGRSMGSDAEGGSRMARLIRMEKDEGHTTLAEWTAADH